MLHIAIIIFIHLTFPTVPNTVSTVSPTLSQTIHHSCSSTYDFYRCGYTNLGILIFLNFDLSMFNLCMLFKRCPSHHVSSQYLLNFSCCLSKYYHCFLCFSFSYGLLLFFLLFLHYCRSFFLYVFYTTVSKLFTILRLLLLMLVSFSLKYSW